MNKTAPKRNKKEEQKKLMVRIVCISLVVVLAVTSLLAMFPTLFQSSNEPVVLSLEDLIAMGMVKVDEEGNIVSVDESLIVDSAAEEDSDAIVADTEVETEAAESVNEPDDHEGHNHD